MPLYFLERIFNQCRGCQTVHPEPFALAQDRLRRMSGEVEGRMDPDMQSKTALAHSQLLLPLR
jgi:hypothetical protein